MSESRTRIWFALFVVAVFCVGGAAGFILGRHAPPFPGPGRLLEDMRGPEGRGFGRGGPGRRGGPPFGPPGAAGIPPEMAGRLANELALDDRQRAEFRKVLEEHRPRLEQVHREARDRFEAEQRQLHDAIRALLRPDQVQRFDQFMNGRR